MNAGQSRFKLALWAFELWIDELDLIELAHVIESLREKVARMNDKNEAHLKLFKLEKKI